MPDQTGFITKEADEVLWQALNALWLQEHKPGTVMKGSVHYSVQIDNDVPRFFPQKNQDLYNSISMVR